MFVLPEWLSGQWIFERMILPILLRLNPRQWSWRQDSPGAPPRETVRLHCERADWNLGTINDEPAMQCHSHWRVTNIIGKPVELWTARPLVPRSLRQLFQGRPRVPIQFVAVRHSERDIYSRKYPILAHETSEASFDFWIQPPIRQVGRDLVLDLIVVDQFGNEHRVRRAVFRGPRPPRPNLAPAAEPLYALSDPIEKDVAAVLKNELTRYQRYGRGSGGLGSVTVGGSPNVPTEYRRRDVAGEQLIVPVPSDGTIRSDNLDALLNRYQGLETDGQREAMRRHLLARLGRSTEYAPVGYLVLFFFQRIGHLAACLDRAKFDLQGDMAYGYSDLLRLLDLLLLQEHHCFDLQMLEEIERSLDGSEEHAFHILERISAIRAARLRG